VLPALPILLLAGGHDLSTPLGDARAEAALAPDGRLFVVAVAAHSIQNRGLQSSANGAQGIPGRQFLERLNRSSGRGR
jgi:hypothetical protein